MNCPVCNLKSEPYTTALKYYSGSSDTCTLFYCKKCVCFFKDNENGALETDFSSNGIKAYNSKERYDWAYAKRINFLKFVHKYVVNKVDNSKQINSWLDYGSGMGFLLVYLKEYYKDLAGVEIAEYGRSKTSEHGVEAFPTMTDIPKGKKYDVISAIDSFYYSLQPRELIDSFYERLNDDGYIVVRVSLRTWFIRFNKMLNKKPDNSLRDHFIDYSYRSIVQLFEDNGFEKVASTFKESGKTYYSLTTTLFNIVTPIVYYASLGKMNLHTGVTLLFKKK